MCTKYVYVYESRIIVYVLLIQHYAIRPQPPSRDGALDSKADYIFAEVSDIMPRDISTFNTIIQTEPAGTFHAQLMYDVQRPDSSINY